MSESSTMKSNEKIESEKSIDETKSNKLFYEIPYETEILNGFEGFLKLLRVFRVSISSNHYKHIISNITDLWELVRKSFQRIEKQFGTKMKKIENHKKKGYAAKEKLVRNQTLLHKFCEFVKFLKKDKKLLNHKIEKYLKDNHILSTHKQNIDINCGKSMKTRVPFENIVKKTNNCSKLDVISTENCETPKDTKIQFENIMKTTDNYSKLGLMSTQNNKNCQEKGNIDYETDNSFTSLNFENNDNVGSDPDSESEDTEFIEEITLEPEIYKFKNDYTKLSTGEFQCTFCDKILPNFSGFLRHSVSHEEQTQLCQTCGKYFEAHRKCIMHSIECRRKLIPGREKKPRKRDISTLSCPFNKCSKRFPEKNLRYYEHCDFHKKIKPYSCNTCCKQFSRAYYMFAHLDAKSKCSLKKCTLPEYAPKVANLKEYLELAAIDYDYVCQLCNRKLETEFKLREHENTHTDEKPYFCSCGATYTNFSNLKNHTISTNCDIKKCQFPFYFKGTRIGEKAKMAEKQKLMQSSGEKIKKKSKRKKVQYFCLKCDIDLKTYSSFRNHRQNYHLEKKFECSECDRKFPTQATLNGHVKKFHLGTYSCHFELCEAKKMTYGQFRYHQKNYHFQNKLGLFACYVCDMSFGNNEESIKHVKKMGHLESLARMHCSICNKRYNYLDYLHHLEEGDHKQLELSWRQKFNIKSFKCPYICEENCDIDNLKSYLKHIEDKHENSRFESAMKQLEKLNPEKNEFKN